MRDLFETLETIGAYRRGHFLLTSGRHSPAFLLLARAFERPELGARLGRALAAEFQAERIAVVVGPAMGGILLAYEVARHLPPARALFAEKTEEGGMELRRGFRVEPGERALVVEDVVTTGGSVAKVIQHLRELGAVVVGVGAVVDRSGGRVSFDGLPFRAVATLELPQYLPDECPECRLGVPLERPKR